MTPILAFDCFTTDEVGIANVFNIASETIRTSSACGPNKIRGIVQDLRWEHGRVSRMAITHVIAEYERRVAPCAVPYLGEEQVMRVALGAMAVQCSNMLNRPLNILSGRLSDEVNDDIEAQAIFAEGALIVTKDDLLEIYSELCEATDGQAVTVGSLLLPKPTTNHQSLAFEKAQQDAAKLLATMLQSKDHPVFEPSSIQFIAKGNI